MAKRLFLFAVFVIIASGLFVSPAFAAYSWVDDNGVFHITDYPKPVKHEEPEKKHICALRLLLLPPLK